ncbi:hypothetical protein J6590_040780 [Homalodisca vitripennis]|nr:hypothetical protein J6590_040780 [Homalodisca vitripennis]
MVSGISIARMNKAFLTLDEICERRILLKGGYFAVNDADKSLQNMPRECVCGGCEMCRHREGGGAGRRVRSKTDGRPLTNTRDNCFHILPRTFVLPPNHPPNVSTRGLECVRPGAVFLYYPTYKRNRARNISAQYVNHFLKPCNAQPLDFSSPRAYHLFHGSPPSLHPVTTGASSRGAVDKNMPSENRSHQLLGLKTSELLVHLVTISCIFNVKLLINN